MAIIESCDNPQVKYHSSISQHKNTLCVMKRNEWIPISFDSLDWINCKHVESHLACLTDGDDIGFNFDVKNCMVLTRDLLYHDENQIVMKPLPQWFGFGFYNDVLNEQSFIAADNTDLGENNLLKLRVGLNYAISDKVLTPEE